jgi:hypothetical protein
VLTLDAQGDSNAVFIFVTSGYLAVSPASQMILANGARADHGELGSSRRSPAFFYFALDTIAALFL